MCVVVVVTFDRKHWLQGLSSNDVVIGLLLANTGVFLMWRVFDQRFMMNNFMVSPQKILHLYRHVLFWFMFMKKGDLDVFIWYPSWYWKRLTIWLISFEQISLDNFTSGRLHTLITSAFSHIDIGHIVSNMIGLYFFGTSVHTSFLLWFVFLEWRALLSLSLLVLLW